jgi:hypothetical protein
VAALRLHRFGHGGPGQAVVAVAALGLDRQQAAVEQPPQVRAGGRRAHPGLTGQLARGQRPPGEQRVHHPDPRRVGEQPGHLGNVGIHAPSVRMDGSSPVEVLMLHPDA